MATAAQTSVLCLKDLDFVTPELRVFSLSGDDTVLNRTGAADPDDDFDSRPFFNYALTNDVIRFTSEKLTNIEEGVDYYVIRLPNRDRIKVAASVDGLSLIHI